MPKITEFQKINQPQGGKFQARVLITGYTQGVGFRWFLHKKAQECGAVGWVHNLEDGRLEAVFEGNRDQVETMISHSRSGPEAAKVTDIQIFWEQPEGRWDELEITY
jgi:acylphosphatase